LLFRLLAACAFLDQHGDSVGQIDATNSGPVDPFGDLLVSGSRRTSAMRAEASST